VSETLPEEEVLLDDDEQPSPLSDEDRETMARLLGSPIDFPLRFKAWLERFVSLQTKKAPSPWAVGDIKATSRPISTAGGEQIVEDATGRWLVCNGAAVSRSKYPELHAIYAAAGYPYGAGDGATTFGIPNGRTRTLVGAGTDFTIGAQLGAREVTLTAAQSGIPAHNHPVTDPQHTHGVNDPGHVHPDSSSALHVSTDMVTRTQFDVTVVTSASLTYYGTNGGYTGITTQNAATGITVGNATAADATQAHQNLQPSQVIGGFLVRV
jgi:microcystin-dependent protein